MTIVMKIIINVLRVVLNLFLPNTTMLNHKLYKITTPNIYPASAVSKQDSEETSGTVDFFFAPMTVTN
jgi:hypothetical protein